MMKNTLLYAALILAVAAAGLKFEMTDVQAERGNDQKSAVAERPENTTPQTIPFGQDWTTNFITANDDWSMVPGIEGFLGQDISTTIGVDARTLLTSSTLANDLDVIANQTNPDTLTNGGVAEFDGIPNPVVALQGSGTADAPYLLIHINTFNRTNVRIAFEARDIDNSADNSIQQLNVQYRVGSTGSFSNVPGGYFADVSAGPNLTQSTPVAVTLPPAANNQTLVQVRIMTVNAPGSDEWIGIDNLAVTQNGPANTARTNVDYDGNGKTDYSVIRNEGGLAVWYWTLNGGAGTSSGHQWGLFTQDRPVPADYDGDGKTDIAVWRESMGPDPKAYFYIFQSSTGTVRADQFGTSGDSPKVVGDYDGDGKSDLAVYRENGTAADPCGVGKAVWYYRPSGTVGADFTSVCWGQNGDVETGGDFDGDGKFDFMVRRNVGGNGVFYLRRSSDSGFEVIYWGRPDDTIIPGDYDGDGKWDLALGRINGTDGELYILERDGGGTGAIPFVIGNIMGEVDKLAQGDYDGDGKQDIAVLKLSAAPGPGFVIRKTSTGTFEVFPFGQTGDESPAEWNTTCGC